VKLRLRGGEDPGGAALPFGVAEIAESARGAAAVLDIGCGSGRLTVELARRGARVTGIDTHAGRLGAARDRARAAGAAAVFIDADMDAPLPFADGAFAAVVSRLALMVAREPVATLREAARVTEPGGAVVTAVWAPVGRNPWFGEPRAAAAAALGRGRAAFARPFGRLGDVDELVALHRRAGLDDVRGRMLVGAVAAADASAHWAHLVATNGHFARLDAALSRRDRAALDAELERRLEPYRSGSGLRLPRAMALVSALRGEGRELG
jgi:SAM-dependent methyltransferase